MTIVSLNQAISDIENIFGLTEDSIYHKIGSCKFIIPQKIFNPELSLNKVLMYLKDNIIRHIHIFNYDICDGFLKFELTLFTDMVKYESLYPLFCSFN